MLAIENNYSTGRISNELKLMKIKYCNRKSASLNYSNKTSIVKLIEKSWILPYVLKSGIVS